MLKKIIFVVYLYLDRGHYMAQGLSIVGYFHANERFSDVEFSGVAKNLDDHYFSSEPILLIKIVYPLHSNTTVN